MLWSSELSHKLQTLCVCVCVCVCYINLSLAVTTNKLFWHYKRCVLLAFSIIFGDGNFDRKA